MGGSKNVKKQRFFIICHRTKIQDFGSLKKKGLKKLSYLYNVEILNHIIIYNLMFNSVVSYCICSPCYMTNNV